MNQLPMFSYYVQWRCLGCEPDKWPVNIESFELSWCWKSVSKVWRLKSNISFRTNVRKDAQMSKNMRTIYGGGVKTSARQLQLFSKMVCLLIFFFNWHEKCDQLISMHRTCYTRLIFKVERLLFMYLPNILHWLFFVLHQASFKIYTEFEKFNVI